MKNNKIDKYFQLHDFYEKFLTKQATKELVYLSVVVGLEVAHNGNKVTLLKFLGVPSAFPNKFGTLNCASSSIDIS